MTVIGFPTSAGVPVAKLKVSLYVEYPPGLSRGTVNAVTVIPEHPQRLKNLVTLPEFGLNTG